MNDTADGLGDVLTGGIAAREIDRGGHGGAAHAGHGAEGAGGTCLNCGAVRVGGFCHDCGQSGHVHRTVAAIGHDIAHGVFHFEGKFWATLPMLVRTPGELTRRYVHGERMKFVSPMALFLFSVFLLFAAVNRVSAPDVAGVGQGLARAKVEMGKGAEQTGEKLGALQARRAAMLAKDARADTGEIDRKIAKTEQALAALGRMSADMPPVTSHLSDVEGFKTGISPVDRQIEHVQENPALYLYKLKMASYKFSWALIPISVPFIWMMFFWRRDVGLYDHAIFAIYSLSFMTLLVVGLIGLYLLGVAQAWLWLVFMIVPPIHMYRQLKGAYRLGRFGALWRTVTLLVSTSLAGGLFFGLLLWLEAE